MYVAIVIIYSGNVEHISNLLFEQYLCEKKKFMNLKIHDIFAHFFFLHYRNISLSLFQHQFYIWSARLITRPFNSVNDELQYVNQTACNKPDQKSLFMKYYCALFKRNILIVYTFG